MSSITSPAECVERDPRELLAYARRIAALIEANDKEPGGGWFAEMVRQSTSVGIGHLATTLAREPAFAESVCQTAPEAGVLTYPLREDDKAHRAGYRAVAGMQLAATALGRPVEAEFVPGTTLWIDPGMGLAAAHERYIDLMAQVSQPNQA